MRRWQLCFAVTTVLLAKPQAQREMTINALQWNPHWECFEQSPECKAQVLKDLSARLVNGTDFANVVELETKDFILPSGWKNISSVCGRDTTTLFYDSTRWSKMENSVSGGVGCMVENDRAYLVQAFEHRTEDLKFIVVGAHFPHGQIGTSLPGTIADVVRATSIQSMMLIADTNINRPNAWPSCSESWCRSSEEIFETIGAMNTDKVISTDLLKTCCHNPPYGFSFEFDRIIANFGTAMTTELHDDPAPSWAVGAFHKALTGRFVVPLSTDAKVELV